MPLTETPPSPQRFASQHDMRIMKEELQRGFKEGLMEFASKQVKDRSDRAYINPFFFFFFFF
jgi:hypothetical protein